MLCGIMINVVMMNVVMLNVVMLSAIMLSDVAPIKLTFGKSEFKS
jgi:hypothetical protein